VKKYCGWDPSPRAGKNRKPKEEKNGLERENIQLDEKSKNNLTTRKEKTELGKCPGPQAERGNKKSWGNSGPQRKTNTEGSREKIHPHSGGGVFLFCVGLTSAGERGSRTTKKRKENRVGIAFKTAGGA